MFSHLGWGEMLVLVVVGLLVFGPERLPKVIADASRMARQMRALARSAASDLKSELGPEMADLDLRSLHPRSILEDVWSDDEDVPAAVNAGIQYDEPVSSVPLGANERPPYDPDAT